MNKVRKNPEKDPIHIDLATDIARALFNADYNSAFSSRLTFDAQIAHKMPFPEDDKKVLCQMLGKLCLPDEVDDDKIRILKLLITNLRSVNRGCLSVTSLSDS